MVANRKQNTIFVNIIKTKNMLVDTLDLVKISTYAKSKNKSRTWIDKLIEKGDLEEISIDGVKFVKVEDFK